MGGGMAAWLVTSTPNASNAEREVIMATGPAMVMVMVHDHGDRHRQFPPFSSHYRQLSSRHFASTLSSSFAALIFPPFSPLSIALNSMTMMNNTPLGDHELGQ